MKKRFLLVGALATTLTFGGLFTPKLVNAATPTTQAEEENNDYYVLPNGEHFLTKRTLKNGKTLEFYDVKPYEDSKGVDCKAIYDGEEFKLIDYNLETGYVFIANPEYDYKDKSTQKFRVRANPETYFPALTATKKVNDLIQKYKDPSKSMLPENVDKTSELYLDMKSCADEAIKDCKTEYEKIITLDKYVHSIISYDLSCKGYSLEKSWEEKKGVCGQYAEIMVRLCQIEGIPSSYVESLPKEKKGHACVFSYDSQNKKWILSDPTNYVADWDVHSWANQVDMIFIDNNYLKKDNCYFSLDYDKNNPNNATDKNTWDEMENWGLNLQKFDLSNGSDIVVPNDIDGIPVTYVRGLTADLTSIKLPSSLIKIKDDAFNSMDTLKSLVIDGGAPNLNELGERSFSGCSNIEELDLSGLQAFYGISIHLDKNVRIGMASFYPRTGNIMGLFRQVLRDENLFTGLDDAGIIDIHVLNEEPGTDAIVCQLASLLGQLQDVIVQQKPCLVLGVGSPIARAPGPVLCITVVFGFRHSVFGSFDSDTGLKPSPHGYFAPV